MQDEIQIDHCAIAAFYRAQNRAALDEAIERGEWTADEAAQAHAQFMESDVLQRLIAGDVAMVEAVMKGQVH